MSGHPELATFAQARYGVGAKPSLPRFARQVKHPNRRLCIQDG